jgi:hypothetical protein
MVLSPFAFPPSALVRRGGLRDDGPRTGGKGTPMNQVMIIVEFEVKPEFRTRFVELPRHRMAR